MHKKILTLTLLGLTFMGALPGEEKKPLEEDEELIADREHDVDDFNLYERNKMDLERNADRLMRHRCYRYCPPPPAGYSYPRPE